MNIITGTKDDLKILIDGAYQRLRRSKDKFEKYALIDYLTELHGLESGLTGENVSFDERRAMLSNSQQRKYSKYMDYLFGRLDDEFIKFRDCHNEIFGTMLTIDDDILDSVVEDCYAEQLLELTTLDEFIEEVDELKKIIAELKSVGSESVSEGVVFEKNRKSGILYMKKEGV